MGNTQDDAGSHQILANVQTRNQMVVIDPVSQKIVGRHALAGGKSPHGLLIVAPKRLAFVACEGDSKLLVVDIETFQVRQVLSTGDGPDVLAFDSGFERLYVATERVGPNSHTVSVDPETHDVYLPLENVNGHPVLRIMTAKATLRGS